MKFSDLLFDIADALEKKQFIRFAEQLRSAALSISNNITEGSGSTSRCEFHQFLNIARRSVFECANMLLIFQRRGFVSYDRCLEILQRLDILARKITQFQRSLK